MTHGDDTESAHGAGKTCSGILQNSASLKVAVDTGAIRNASALKDNKSISAEALHKAMVQALPDAIKKLTKLREGRKPLSNEEVAHIWELMLYIENKASALKELITRDVISVKATTDVIQRRASLLDSLRNFRVQLESALDERVEAMKFKPRLYRLRNLLELTRKELHAFMFIVMNCAGVDGPSDDEEVTSDTKSDLYKCRAFAGFSGAELLDFLSPSRKHFSQGLLEYDDNYANRYSEVKFRAPREVLKAIYGGDLTVDEAMTMDKSSLADVLAEEPGSVFATKRHVGGINLPDNLSSDQSKSQTGSSSSVHVVTTDDSEMIELLSDLRVEEGKRHSEVKTSSAKRSASRKEQNKSMGNGIKTTSGDAEEVEEDKGIIPYIDNMEYLQDGFVLVEEACKLHSYKESFDEEDRSSSTKRPVEALQREAKAKYRKAYGRFTRRLAKTNEKGGFVPPLELLVAKLHLDHFERMVVLTLVGSVLSQPVRKALRRDASENYSTWVTVAKLLRVHCGGDLKEEIQSRFHFYRKAALVRSGIIKISAPYETYFSDLGEYYCELDHLMLDYVAGLETELSEIMDNARCFLPQVSLDSVVLPEKVKEQVLHRVENFEVFRKMRKDLGFDDIVRYGRGLTLFFHGPPGTGKTLFANALAAHLNKKLLVVDFASSTSKCSGSEAYRLIFREARIHSAIVFIDECDGLFKTRKEGEGDVTAALHEMENFDGVVILATNRPQVLDEAMHRRISLALEFVAPDANLRLEIWKAHIPQKLQLGPDIDLGALAVEFELTGGFIKNAIFEALATAVTRIQKQRKEKGSGDFKELESKDIVLNMKELRHACRLQARGDLKRTKLERRKIPLSGLNTLVTSEEAMSTLRDIVQVEKVRNVLSTRWGFKRRQARSNCVLLLGPQGCGKSHTAGALGYETGRQLQILSMSELNGSSEGAPELGDMFREAAVAGAVVVIEQAEQLMYEASKVDNIASPGLELLYHIQEYNGLVVLCVTTAIIAADAGWLTHSPIPNRIACILSYYVQLVKPDREARTRLWKQLIPKDTPLDDDVAEVIETVAERYELTGARIQSCIRRAASAAAMRANRLSFTEQDDSSDAKSKPLLCADDLEAACEAEIELTRAANSSAAWVRRLYL